MKRGREDSDTASCLMLLSKVGSGSETDFGIIKKETSTSYSSSSARVFACKTCNREFPSFQALGGHRASHKKLPKLSSDGGAAQSSPASPPKPKTHECSICGLEFAIGQALGGHMRRHRQQGAPDNNNNNHDNHDHVDHDRTTEEMVVPWLKKSSSSKRICLDLDLDLHLGPPGDHYNDLKLRLMAPIC